MDKAKKQLFESRAYRAGRARVEHVYRVLRACTMPIIVFSRVKMIPIFTFVFILSLLTTSRSSDQKFHVVFTTNALLFRKHDRDKVRYPPPKLTCTGASSIEVYGKVRHGGWAGSAEDWHYKSLKTHKQLHF